MLGVFHTHAMRFINFFWLGKLDMKKLGEPKAK